MEPKPICLCISLATAAFILVTIGAAIWTNSHTEGTGEELPADFGQGLLHLAILLAVYFIGIISAIYGLVREERPKVALYSMLVAFVAPYVIFLVYGALHPTA